MKNKELCAQGRERGPSGPALLWHVSIDALSKWWLYWANGMRSCMLKRKVGRSFVPLNSWKKCEKPWDSGERQSKGLGKVYFFWQSLGIGWCKQNPGILLVRSCWVCPLLQFQAMALRENKIKRKSELVIKGNLRVWDNAKHQTFSDFRCLDTFKNFYLRPSSVVVKADPELGRLNFLPHWVSL